MCASVEEVLQREFGTSISEPGVQILDPAVGTGSFIVNLVHRIPSHKLKYKYQHDLFCNEITLLPYYIASLNIEHEYYERMNEYEPFEGICFADTLELAEGQQLSLFVEENTERVQREKDAQIMVVVGNPPYNVGQLNENDNNKNRKYPIIDGRIKDTYVKDSKATNRNALSDAYVKFFRWATDRLQTILLSIKLLSMVCENICNKISPRSTTLIYMAMCAKIQNSQARLITFSVSRSE
jgi:predicted helicase